MVSRLKIQHFLIIWNLNICCITEKWDVCIHASKCTPHAFKHSEQVTKRHSSPEMHPNLTPVQSMWQPTASSPNDLKGNLKQHPHHNMEAEEVWPFLPPHHPKVCYKEISQQEPGWQSPYECKEGVGEVLKVLQERMKMVCGLGIHPCLMQRH